MKLFERSVSTSLIINKPVTQVWPQLADFVNYNKWNTLVPFASGPLKSGEMIHIKVVLPTKKAMNYRVRLTELVVEEFLQWQGHFFIPGLFDGLHGFRLRAHSANETELIQEETFRGLLVPFLWPSLGPKFYQAFNESNMGLKKYAEEGS